MKMSTRDVRVRVKLRGPVEATVRAGCRVMNLRSAETPSRGTPPWNSVVRKLMSPAV